MMWRRLTGLRRFRRAQDPVIATVVVELCTGQKMGHWMWFVFPQGKGLGTSRMSKLYALSRREASRFNADPVLGRRLRLCTEVVTVQLAAGRPLELIFGDVDAMKFRSCMQLFASVAPAADGTYAKALELVRHEDTMRVLG